MIYVAGYCHQCASQSQSKLPCYIFVFTSCYFLFRVICAKRPEPPRDNHTPVAAHKKRRSVVSDGAMKVLPSYGGTDLTHSHVTTTARLQKCKSMVERSATYEMNKSKFSHSCCAVHPLRTLLCAPMWFACCFMQLFVAFERIDLILNFAS